jgi:hypothetical protein
MRYAEIMAVKGNKRQKGPRSFSFKRPELTLSSLSLLSIPGSPFATVEAVGETSGSTVGPRKGRSAQAFSRRPGDTVPSEQDVHAKGPRRGLQCFNCF